MTGLASFLIPFRDDDGTRTPAHTWLLTRWQHTFPNAQFITHHGDTHQPFNKALAVNQAAQQAHNPTLIILDADTWTHPQTIQRSLALAADGHWVIPCLEVRRLTLPATQHLLSLRPEAEWPENLSIEEQGAATGGIHVVPREAFDLVGGMDVRFRGWGMEDSAFKMALDTLWSEHIRLNAPLFHLWHDRTPGQSGGREWPGQTARNTLLGARYRAAHNHPEAMLELIRERV